MRINQFVAQATGLSRRKTDIVISEGRVSVNNAVASVGQNVDDTDKVYLDNNLLTLPQTATTLLIDKPVGYVCSRDGQGSPTIYDLVPKQYSQLKHVGRLDKDSSGLVVLTNDGNLTHGLSHPKFNKSKLYRVKLDKKLQRQDKEAIEAGEVKLDGKPSIMKIRNSQTTMIEVELHEGRNRQIRRTLSKLGYQVVHLRRHKLGPYNINQLDGHRYIKVSS